MNNLFTMERIYFKYVSMFRPASTRRNVAHISIKSVKKQVNSLSIFILGAMNNIFHIDSNIFFRPGTLTSITNFASSLSRNMDLLSLDHNYREQQDWLRQRPLGVAEGVRSGLTGFGLSLLGKLSLFCITLD